MNRILVIAWCFPPKQDSESIVTYKHLKNSKYVYDIVTDTNNLKSSNNDFDLKKFNIINVNKKEFYDNPFKFVDFNKYSIFMTRSMPEDGHSVGLKIKKKYPNLKWIASYSDPNFNSPYISYLYEKTKKQNILKLPKFIYSHWYYYSKNRYYNNEFKKIIDMADCIIFNNKYQKDYMLGDIKIKKYLILPHSFEKYELKQKKAKNNNNEKIIVSYLGTLDKVRNPAFLFESLYKIKKENFELIKNIVFQFYGSMPEEYKEYANKNLKEIVKIYDEVSYEVTKKVMNNSDYLLIIDANLKEVLKNQIFLPAKTFEYMAMKKNMIAITMKHGPIADLMKEFNQILIPYDYQILLNSLKKLKHNKIIEYNPSYYDSKNISKLMDDKISEIIGGKNV